MLKHSTGGVAAGLRLLHLSALQIAGRKFWLLPLLPAAWLGFQAILLVTGTQSAYQEPAAQNTLIGVPVTVLAVFLGVRIIAGEIDRRSLEIAYTVPGGSHRVWLTNLAAAALLLAASELALAVLVFAFFTPFPAGALYGALQGALFYLVLAMALAALFRSEVAGAMVTTVVLGLNGFITAFGQNQMRLSPFWNPLALPGEEAPQVFAWTLQNRIGFVLATAAVMALAFVRAERRERMLGA